MLDFISTASAKLAVYQRRPDGLAAEKPIAESASHGNRLVGIVSVRAGIISSVASLVFPPGRVSADDRPFLFEASCSLLRGPFHPLVRWEMSSQTGSPKMALYSLAGSARSPVHAEPTQQQTSSPAWDSVVAMEIVSTLSRQINDGNYIALGTPPGSSRVCETKLVSRHSVAASRYSTSGRYGTNART
jgi:hypothetical protein